MASETLSSVLNGSIENKAANISDLINDEHFIRDLKRLKDLRSFLIQEAAFNITTEDGSTALSFGGLNQLRFGMIEGRAPTLEEWSEVEHHTRILFSLLTEPLRRRFILGGIPMWVSALPIVLATVAVVALLEAVRYQIGIWELLFYIIWLICLGAIGSIASIGMNALSIQQDITFDLTNRRLMLLRISLGALFGLVLTIPFGFQSFVQFTLSINEATKRVTSTLDPRTITTQSLVLLLPFILGFSTSLVIMILNRLIEAVQAFFGRTGTSDVVASKSASQSSSERKRGTDFRN